MIWLIAFLMFVLVSLWAQYGIFKAITDAKWFGEKVVRKWLEKFGQRWLDFYDGKRGLLTVAIKQGYIWSTDYWHTFDTLRSLVATLAMPIAFVLGFILALFYGRELATSWLFWIGAALFTLFCWWIPTFTLFYKVILMREWTLKQWVVNHLQVWK